MSGLRASFGVSLFALSRIHPIYGAVARARSEVVAMLFRKSPSLPGPGEALPGRGMAIPTATTHFVNGRALQGPWPEGLETAIFAMGCFWGVERVFWKLPGVWSTAVGYINGLTPNPTYEEVCSGRTGHTEAVLVVFDPNQTSYGALLKTFWENHDPTQGMRQGNDIGTQYRSGVYTINADQAAAAAASRDVFQAALSARGLGTITSEIVPAAPFYFAEAYHQQYLAKNPGGYCGIGGTGVTCPIGVGVSAGA
jgi:peptide-methionine (S)-S-oxide reductase